MPSPRKTGSDRTGEVKALWQLLEKLPQISTAGDRSKKKYDCVTSGTLKAFPRTLSDELQAAVAQTAHFDKLTLSLAINYGGRQEIARAARLFAADVQQGKCDLHELSPETLFPIPVHRRIS